MCASSPKAPRLTFYRQLNKEDVLNTSDSEWAAAVSHEFEWVLARLEATRCSSQVLCPIFARQPNKGHLVRKLPSAETWWLDVFRLHWASFSPTGAHWRAAFSLCQTKKFRQNNLNRYNIDGHGNIVADGGRNEQDWCYTETALSSCSYCCCIHREKKENL